VSGDIREPQRGVPPPAHSSGILGGGGGGEREGWAHSLSSLSLGGTKIKLNNEICIHTVTCVNSNLKKSLEAYFCCTICMFNLILLNADTEDITENNLVTYRS
jgi:hypothetical protein